MENNTNIQYIYSLTPMQSGMLFHSLKDHDSTAYFEQNVLSIQGQVDREILAESFLRIIQRYDVLRTIFLYEELDEPFQVVLAEREVEIGYQDLSGLNGEELSAAVSQFKEEDRRQGFDLTSDLLMRMSLLQVDEDRYELVWSFHHIILDGWCLGIIFKELFYIYQQLVQGKEVQLESAIPYQTYIDWLEDQDQETGLKFWESYLSDYETHATVPSGKESREQTQPGQYQLAEYKLVLDEMETRGLMELARENKVTTNTLFQTIWGILLQRYNNTQDVVFGAVVSGRPTEIDGIENMVGLFVNTVPVRIQVQPEETIAELLGRVQEQGIRSKSFEYLPLVEIQNTSSLKNRLIDHLMVFENYPLQDELGGMQGEQEFQIRGIETFEQTSYDFNLIIIPGETMTVKFSYNGLIYDQKWVEKMAGHFRYVIQQMLGNPTLTLREVKLLQPEEEVEILALSRGPEQEFPQATIPQLFEEQVAQNGSKIALIFGEEKMTYQQLNQRANQLARTLRQKGIGPNQVVGLLVERSCSMVVGMLAILKAGGAYLPIDSGYPVERKAYMLEDSGVQLILTDQPTGLAEKMGGNLQVVDLKAEEQYSGDASNLELVNRPEDLVYVIYTSGSTGQSKGVMLEHQNLVNLIRYQQEYTNLEFDRVLQFATISFDVSFQEIFSTLLAGGRLVLIDQVTRDHPEALFKVVAAEEVKTLFLPAAFLRLIFREEGYLNLIPGVVEHIVSAGEQLMVTDRVREFLATNQVYLHNHYGPSETHVVTALTLEPAREIPDLPSIGRPILNTRIYLLDQYQQLVPPGVPGELYIGGQQVGRGYLNRAELTQERFITTPYQPGERLYRTGDLARWLPDGTIEYLGRMDQQVKIRGFRIELGEIESRLLELEAVNAAVVIDREDSQGQKQLYAYLVSDSELDPVELRRLLRAKLPDYMIPTYFIPLAMIPLTPNGKVDKGALPEPEIWSTDEYVAPRTSVEEALASVWSEVLGIPKVGIQDNFFSLGGDSIKGIQIASRLQRYDLKLEIRNLFDYPTIAELSSTVQEMTQSNDQQVVEGDVPLTPIVQWFFEKIKTDRHHWNQAVMLQRTEGFIPEWVRVIFTELLEKHDALRMTYQDTEAGIIQTNQGLDGKLFDLEVIDLTHIEEFAQELEARATQIQASIDLTTGPLVKLGLFKTQSGDHLLIAIHHLVIDGISWRIIFEDLGIGYQQLERGQALELPPKTTSFKVWSEKLYDYANSPALQDEVAYWQKVNATPVQPLPKKQSASTNRVQDSDVVELVLDQATTRQLLQEAHRAYNTAINDLLLAGLVKTVQGWTGEQQVAIALEAHGREEIMEDVDITRTIGWFATIYPVIFGEEGQNLSHLIKGVKEKLRRAPKKGIGYFLLKYLADISPESGDGFNLEPEIHFNYLGQFDQDLTTDLFTLSTLSSGQVTSEHCERLFPISINGMVVGGQLRMILEYNQHEYDESVMSQFMDTYQQNLRGLIGHCLQQEEAEMTASDFSASDIDDDEVTAIFELLDDDLFE